jgi:phosphoribosylglycinamide formyltransferase-1
MNLGVLVSGRGSNLAAILAAISEGRLPARVVLVLSNRERAPGLAVAQAAALRTAVVSHRDYDTREGFDARLVTELRAAGAEYVVLAGFMRIVTRVLLDAFPNRVINIHPALLPAFPGLDAQAQALGYGARITGCTVHFVDAGTDSGPIIAQAAVPILDGDDHEALSARILKREHELLVRVLSWVASGNVRVIPASASGGRPTVEVRGERTFFGLSTEGEGERGS